MTKRLEADYNRDNQPVQGKIGTIIGTYCRGFPCGEGPYKKRKGQGE